MWTKRCSKSVQLLLVSISLTFLLKPDPSEPNPLSYNISNHTSIDIQDIHKYRYSRSIQDIENDLPQCLPVERLVEGKARPHDSINDSSFPPWLDLGLVLKGQEFAQRYFFQLFFSLFHAMTIQSLCQPTIRHVFHYTGKLESRTASKRLTSNFLQNKVWFDTPFSDFNTPVFDSLIKLRSIHSTIAYSLKKNKIDLSKPVLVEPERPNENRIQSRMWRSFKRDLKASKLLAEIRKKDSSKLKKIDDNYIRFNQYDLAMAQWTNLCLPLIRTKELNFHGVTDDDLKSFIHLWAGIGWFLGIEDEFNLGLQPNISATRDTCSKILENELLPYLLNIDYETQVDTETFIEGIMEIIPILNTKDGYLMSTMEEIVGIPMSNMKRDLGWQGRLVKGFEHRIMNPLSSRPSFRNAQNYFIRMWLRIASLKFFGFDGLDNDQVVSEGFF